MSLSRKFSSPKEYPTRGGCPHQLILLEWWKNVEISFIQYNFVSPSLSSQILHQSWLQNPTVTSRKRNQGRLLTTYTSYTNTHGVQENPKSTNGVPLFLTTIFRFHLKNYNNNTEIYISFLEWKKRIESVPKPIPSSLPQPLQPSSRTLREDFFIPVFPLYGRWEVVQLPKKDNRKVVNLGILKPRRDIVTSVSSSDGGRPQS